MPEGRRFKTEENEKIIDIVESILDLNNEHQLREHLKILTPDKILSRLQITLAQLKAGNNSQKLKNQATIMFFIQTKKT